MIGSDTPGPYRLSLPQLALIGTVGVLVIFVGFLLVRTFLNSASTATEFEEAGYGTTNLADVQRHALLLRIETLAIFGDVTMGFDPIDYPYREFEAVKLRRDFLTALLRFESTQVFGNAVAVADLKQVEKNLAEYDNLMASVRADPTFNRLATITQFEEILIRLDPQIKALYDYREARFFRATVTSLGAQKSTQTMLLVAGVIMLALCLVLVASLRQSVRSGFKRAYNILEKEIAERHRLAEENQVIAEIGLVLSSSLDIHEVYDRFGEEIRKLLHFDRLSMSLVDNDNETTSPIWASGTEIPGRNTGTNVPLKGALAGEVVRKRSPIFLEVQAKTELEHTYPLMAPAYDAGLRSFIAIPLVDRDVVIGILQIGSINQGIYTQKHLEMLERIGHQIAGTIANSRLFADRQKAEEALRDSENKYRTLFEESPEPIFIAALEDGIIDANEAAAELFGYSREELLRLGPGKLYAHEEERAG